MSDRDCWRTSEGSAESGLIASVEVPGSAADALRALAARLDADEELCLIGAWVLSETAEYIAGTHLQVALTRLASEDR